MPHTADSPAPGSFKGLVYGDLVGSPYMIENTYNRYFELGESRKAYSHGRVRAFFPGVTEVSHGAAAVTRWLSVWRACRSAFVSSTTPIRVAGGRKRPDYSSLPA